MHLNVFQRPSLSQAHFLTQPTCCFPASMVNFRDPAVIAQDSREYTVGVLLYSLRKTTNSSPYQWRWSSCGTPCSVSTCELVGLFSSQYDLYPNSPQVGNTSPLLIMNGTLLGGVSLTGGRYGSVRIFASFGFTLPHESLVNLISCSLIDRSTLLRGCPFSW